MIFKVIILVALTRLLIMTDKPFLCTGLYAAAVVGLGLSTGVPVTTIAISGGISNAVFGAYFWLLNRFHSGILYWLIFVLGITVCLFV